MSIGEGWVITRYHESPGGLLSRATLYPYRADFSRSAPTLRPGWASECFLRWSQKRGATSSFFDCYCPFRSDITKRNLFLKLCTSEAGLARMRSYEAKKITSPSRGFEI